MMYPYNVKLRSIFSCQLNQVNGSCDGDPFTRVYSSINPYRWSSCRFPCSRRIGGNLYVQMSQLRTCRTDGYYSSGWQNPACTLSYCRWLVHSNSTSVIGSFESILSGVARTWSEGHRSFFHCPLPLLPRLFPFCAFPLFPSKWSINPVKEVFRNCLSFHGFFVILGMSDSARRTVEF